MLVYMAVVYIYSTYSSGTSQNFLRRVLTKHRKHEQINNAARGAISDSSKDYFRCCFYYVNTSMMIRSTIQWIVSSCWYSRNSSESSLCCCSRFYTCTSTRYLVRFVRVLYEVYCCPLPGILDYTGTRYQGVYEYDRCSI